MIRHSPTSPQSRQNVNPQKQRRMQKHPPHHVGGMKLLGPASSHGTQISSPSHPARWRLGEDAETWPEGGERRTPKAINTVRVTGRGGARRTYITRSSKRPGNRKAAHNNNTSSAARTQDSGARRRRQDTGTDTPGKAAQTRGRPQTGRGRIPKSAGSGEMARNQPNAEEAQPRCGARGMQRSPQGHDGARGPDNALNLRLQTRGPKKRRFSRSLIVSSSRVEEGKNGWW